MVTIRPFRALRPVPEKVREVASVPYDTVDTTEARLLARDNPLSFLHVIRPEIDLPDTTDPYDDAVYAKGAENLHLLVKKGIMRDEESPCMYLYRLSEAGWEQTGIAACCAVDDYEKGIIKKHEYTRKEKEDDRVRNMLALSAHAGPVLFTFRPTESIDALMRGHTDSPGAGGPGGIDPIYDFTADDGVRHRVWRIEGGEDLVEAFKSVPALYIADGHHRAAGACRVARQKGRLSENDECGFFLAVLFPSDQLRILAYNRYVNDLGTTDTAAFIRKLEKRFSVSRGERGFSRKGRYGMYLDSEWYRLKPKATTLDLLDTDSADPVSALDLTAFQRSLLEPVLGIADQRKDKRIEFVGGTDSAAKLERVVDERGGAAFTFHPVSVEELLTVADAGGIMPPKSTWFSPKLRSGLLVHRF